MNAFSLHIPPAGLARPALLLDERFVWWALLFGPLWLLRHRIWVWGVLGLVVLALGPWQAGLAVHWLAALCGADLRAAALTRRGWRVEAVVMADDGETALRRLLAARPALAGLFRA